MDWEWDEEAQKKRKEEMDRFIIEKYKEDERTMVLIFAQWCVNQEVDAVELYEIAYPGQGKNAVLAYACEQTVEASEAEEITDELLLHVLELFENHDLAFIVHEQMEKRA